MAAFGSHHFYDLFSQGQGGPWPPRPPPGSTTVHKADNVAQISFHRLRFLLQRLAQIIFSAAEGGIDVDIEKVEDILGVPWEKGMFILKTKICILKFVFLIKLFPQSCS